MVNEISSFSGYEGVRRVDSENLHTRQKTSEIKERNITSRKTDRLELSSTQSASSSREAVEGRGDDITSEEQRIAGDNWYRYGMPSAYEALNP